MHTAADDRSSLETITVGAPHKNRLASGDSFSQHLNSKHDNNA